MGLRRLDPQPHLLCHLDRSEAQWRDLWFACVTVDPRYSALVSLRCGKPQIFPLRFAQSKIIPGSLLCQRLWSPTLATQGWGTIDLLEVWLQNGDQSRVPHIWRALCARCGKPQISPLRFAPVEMTKEDVIANRVFLNRFSSLGWPRRPIQHSGRDDKSSVTAKPAFAGFEYIEVRLRYRLSFCHSRRKSASALLFHFGHGVPVRDSPPDLTRMCLVAGLHGEAP